MTKIEGHIIITRAKKDGKSVLSVIKYYLATSASYGITINTDGWTTTVQTINATSKYLWTYEVVSYSDGTSTNTDPVISGVYGEQGYNGCITRCYQNGIVVGQEYHNDVSTSGITGKRYLDIIMIEDSSYSSGYAAYECNTTYTAISTSDYTDTDKWTKLSENVSSAFFNFIIAQNAYIKLLSGARVVVMDDDNNVDGGMQGDPSKPVFWAGATLDDIADAPFRVYKNGKLRAVGAKIIGSYRNPFILYNASGLVADYNDHVAFRLSNTNDNTYALPWDITQSGRIIRLINYKYDDNNSLAAAAFNAPSGQYFYDNGNKLSSYSLKYNEYVEILGYGDDNTFYGWIVINKGKIDTLETNAGKILAYGFAFGYSTNVSMGNYHTFDNDSLSIAAMSETGKYKITFPSSWGLSSSNYMVILTGYGYAEDNSTGSIKATLISQSSNYFIVETADDATANKGAFQFLMIRL